MADYDAALKIALQYADTFVCRGWTYTQKDDFDKAVADYTRAIRLEPKNSEAYSYRAFALNKKE
jgi:cytochrome c-type biogenesis protein CcmH/NrfG